MVAVVDVAAVADGRGGGGGGGGLARAPLGRGLHVAHGGAQHGVEVVDEADAHPQQREVVGVDAKRPLELGADVVEAEEGGGDQRHRRRQPRPTLGREHKRQREDPAQQKDLEQLAVRQRQHERVHLVDAAEGGGEALELVGHVLQVDAAARARVHAAAALAQPQQHQQRLAARRVVRRQRRLPCVRLALVAEDLALLPSVLQPVQRRAVPIADADAPVRLRRAAHALRLRVDGHHLQPLEGWLRAPVLGEEPARLARRAKRVGDALRVVPRDLPVGRAQVLDAHVVEHLEQAAALGGLLRQRSGALGCARRREPSEHLDRERPRAADHRTDVRAPFGILVPRHLRAKDHEEGEQRADDHVAAGVDVLLATKDGRDDGADYRDHQLRQDERDDAAMPP